MDGSFAEYTERISKFLTEVNVEDLIVSDEQAESIARDVVNAIPECARGLYPENDLLAAIAYAPVYFTLYPGGVRK